VKADELPGCTSSSTLTERSTAICDSDSPRSPRVPRRACRGARHAAVRGLSMDDAHLFLREDQIEQEIFQLPTSWSWCWGRRSGSRTARPGHPPEKKLGTDATWDPGGGALEQALKHRGCHVPARFRAVGRSMDRSRIKFNDANRPRVAGATIQLRLSSPSASARVHGRG